MLHLRARSRSGPLVAFDHAVLVTKPTLGVELGFEGCGCGVAAQVRDGVASLVPARRQATKRAETAALRHVGILPTTRSCIIRAFS